MNHISMTILFLGLTVGSALARQENVAPLLPSLGPSGAVHEISMKLAEADPNLGVKDTPDIHENASRLDTTLSGTTKELNETTTPSPVSAEKNLPPVLNVKTAALLELHAMRQNAVALCLQLPSKYRTRLPQCGEIFKHEIRLNSLAKDKQ